MGKLFNDRQMEAARENLLRASRKSLSLLVGLLGCTFALDAAIIGGIASGLEALEPSQGELLACVFCIVVLLGSSLGALFLVAGMFKDAMSGRPPFSPKQVRRLNIIGALLLCNAAFGIIWHVVCMFGPLASRGVALAVTPDWLALWAIDILLIVAAIVSFYLSRAFKFAHLLQSFYDESV